MAVSSEKKIQKKFWYGVFVEKPLKIYNVFKKIILFMLKCEFLTPPGKMNLMGGFLIIFGIVIISFSQSFVIIYSIIFGKTQELIQVPYKYIFIYTIGCIIPLSICESIGCIILKKHEIQNSAINKKVS